MICRNKDLLVIFNKNGVNCPVFQFVIHQQALFSNEIETKIINKIWGSHNAFTHRKLKDFLENLNSEHGGLLLYTEASLSRCWGEYISDDSVCI